MRALRCETRTCRAVLGVRYGIDQLVIPARAKLEVQDERRYAVTCPVCGARRTWIGHVARDVETRAA